jgi:1-acyl-sn-glycerol-3-phosphate acyltransferase
MEYGFFYWLVRIIFSLYFHIDVTGVERMPRKGALIILVNHIKAIDPPMAAIVIPRSAYFMSKVELFDIPVLGWLISRLHAFPVRRDHADRHAIRMALRILGQQQALMIFPEGHRSETGKLQEARAGAVYLAQKTGTPCIPIGISGHYGFRKTIHFSIGEVFMIPKEMERHEAQKFIMEKISEQVAAPNQGDVHAKKK